MAREWPNRQSEKHSIDAQCGGIHTISANGTAGRLVQGGADAKALDVDRHLVRFRDGDQGDGARPVAAERRVRRRAHARWIGRRAAADDLDDRGVTHGVGASRPRLPPLRGLATRQNIDLDWTYNVYLLGVPTWRQAVLLLSTAGHSKPTSG